jgi:hypothetical protein
MPMDPNGNPWARKVAIRDASPYMERRCNSVGDRFAGLRGPRLLGCAAANLTLRGPL